MVSIGYYDDDGASPSETSKRIQFELFQKHEKVLLPHSNSCSTLLYTSGMGKIAGRMLGGNPRRILEGIPERTLTSDRIPNEIPEDAPKEFQGEIQRGIFRGSEEQCLDESRSETLEQSLEEFRKHYS